VGEEDVIHIVVDAVPVTESGWIDVFSALLVPTIAVVGICIAYQQYRVNKERLRHETYERRLAVYKCVQRYLSAILRDGKVTSDRVHQFISEASEAAFLFDESVQDRIDTIHEKSIDMVTAYERTYPADGSSGLRAGPERNKVAQEHSELLKWHVDQLIESRPFFAKKLGLRIK
jgi:hypothetical protein